jgi:hypothetical protein
MKKCNLLIFFALITFLGYSQEVSYFYFNGNVSDCKDNKSLIYVNDVNESVGYAVASNSQGNFQIKVKVDDILRFTSIGYKTKFLIISENHIYQQQSFCMIPDTVKLQEVTVLPYSNFNEFKTQFLALKTKEESYVIPGITLRNRTTVHNFENEDYINKMALGSPISYFYYKFSKREQNIRKYYEMENDKWNVYTIDQKYNKAIVEKITGLKNDETIKFMAWCNFEREYLLSATYYEISLRIAVKYELYCDIIKKDST